MTSPTLQLIEIERFAIHDGPGIRSVIFFQGCPLHCPWCANPESWEIKSYFFHNENACVHCNTCITQCPTHALYTKGNHIYCQDSLCQKCHHCVSQCLQSAIKFVGRTYTMDEIMNTIAKDNDYYQESHGGITLSGGEVFQQYDGLLVLLKELKKHNYHVCIETCGQFATALLDTVINDVDLFLFDIKHFDPVILKKVTGGDLALIKNNIRKIAANDPTKILLRIPVIPDFNDSMIMMEETAKFAYENHIKKVQLLPFHNLGQSKYKQIGIPYPYEHTPNMSYDSLKKYVSIFSKYDIECILKTDNAEI